MRKINTDDVERWAASGNVKKLCRALECDDASAVRRAARALGEIGDPRAVAPLTRAASSHDWLNGQMEIVSALGCFEDPRSISTLIQLLASSESTLGDAAAAALDKIGEPTVEPLLEALRRCDYELRRLTSLRGRTGLLLGRRGGGRAVPALEAALSTRYEDDYARTDLRRALASLRTGAKPCAPGDMVTVTIAVAGPVLGSLDHAGQYEATLPLDADGPTLLSTIADSVLGLPALQWYTGFQLVCPEGTLRSSRDGKVTPPISLRDAGVTSGTTLEFVDVNYSFM